MTQNQEPTEWTAELLHEATGVTWERKSDTEFCCVYGGVYLTMRKAPDTADAIWGSVLENELQLLLGARTLHLENIRCKVHRRIKAYWELKRRQSLLREAQPSSVGSKLAGPKKLQWSAELLREITGIEWEAGDDNVYSCVYCGVKLEYFPSEVRDSNSEGQMYGHMLYDSDDLDVEHQTDADEDIRRDNIRQMIHEAIVVYVDLITYQNKIIANATSPG